MIGMANLEAKSYMSPTEFALMIFAICVGSQIFLAPQGLIQEAGVNSWMSILLAGFLFFIAACVMLWLGLLFREETLVEYMPRIWGRRLGAVFLVWFSLLFFLQVAVILQGAGKVITFYMFDRTPPEVISLSLLILCVYCALQDFGTILRIQQFLFFVSYSLFLGIWMISVLSFQPENMLPMFPLDTTKIITASFHSWTFYSGYEILLLLLPLVYRRANFLTLVKWVGSAFSGMALLYLAIIAIIIGVMTTASAQNTPYPALIAIRSVEIPGTFIERLESYLLIFWIPVVFDTLAMMVYALAETGMHYFGHQDHRPWVLMVVPLIYSLQVFLVEKSILDGVNLLMLWLGILFSFGVIPITLLRYRWRRRKEKISC